MRPNNAPGQDSNAFPPPSREPGIERRVRPPEPPMRRPPQDSAAGQFPEPLVPDEPPRRGQDTRAQIPRHAPPPPQPGAGGSVPGRLDGLDSPAEAPPDPSGPASGVFSPPEAGGMASGAFPAAPRRRRRVAPSLPAEPHTEQFEPVGTGQFEPVGTGESMFEPAADAPPAGLSTWGRGRPDPLAAEDTQVGVTPVSPGRPDPGDQLEATGFHDPFAEDDEEFDGFDEAEAEHPDDYEYDEEEPQPVDHETQEPGEAEESPARQWMSMAVQVALGVVGGAGVWLAFNWLWVKLPAAALAAAVVVIAGLVWIVRRIRRAEDLQTTVLAVLVGLVVTVSPAALLLLSR